MPLTAPPELERIAQTVVGAAFRVHSELGPGLLESIYEACLEHELRKRDCAVARQLPLPVSYDGMLLDAALRIDLLVDDLVVVEVKAAEQLLPIHEAQLHIYLKLTHRRLGFLINFNVPVIKHGIRRRII